MTAIEVKLLTPTILQTGILGSGSFGIVMRAVDETAVPKHEASRFRYLPLLRVL